MKIKNFCATFVILIKSMSSMAASELGFECDSMHPRATQGDANSLSVYLDGIGKGIIISSPRDKQVWYIRQVDKNEEYYSFETRQVVGYPSEMYKTVRINRHSFELENEWSFGSSTTSTRVDKYRCRFVSADKVKTTAALWTDSAISKKNAEMNADSDRRKKRENEAKF